MRGLAPALVLLVSIQGVLSTAYSCEEIKYKLANQKVSMSGQYACVVFDNSTASTSVDIIFLRNGIHLLSLRQIANQTSDYLNGYGCVNVGGISWQVETQGGTTSDIDCTVEIALIFSSVDPNIIPVRGETGVGTGVQAAIVSVYGGIRLENLRCTGATQSVSFYTGAGASTSEMLYSMVNYTCATLPKTYIAFENVISLKPNGGSISYTATAQYKNGLGLGPGDRATVASSGKADNLQNTHPNDNYAHFDLNSDATVHATGSMQIDPKYQGSIQLVSQGRFENKSQTFTNANLNWTFYADSFEVHYLTSITPQDVWLNNDSFVIEIKLDYLPPNLTTTPAPTTPKPPTTAPVYTTLPPQTTTQQKTTTGSYVTPQAYYDCDIKRVWLDIAFLIDISVDMGQYGAQASLTVDKAVLYTMNITPDPTGRFYSRAAIAAFSRDVTVLGNFSTLTSLQAVRSVHLPPIENTELNITKAIGAAVAIFDSYPVDAHLTRRRVIVLTASTYSDGAEQAASDFKTRGGTLVVIGYTQTDTHPDPRLISLASPGYYFTNSETARKIDFKDLQTAFCDINCYCDTKTLAIRPYTKGNARNVAEGGCYQAVQSSSSQFAADGDCEDIGGYLATIHDDNKQQFLMALFPSKTAYWIGYERVNRVWTWEDSSTEPYVAPGFNPNGPGDCAYSQQSAGFKSNWTKADCFNDSQFYVCQLKPCTSTYYCI